MDQKDVEPGVPAWVPVWPYPVLNLHLLVCPNNDGSHLLGHSKLPEYFAAIRVIG